MGYNQKDLRCISAVKWSTENENNAQKEYVAMMSASCVKFEYTSAGLVINPLYPHLGASPDGFTQCECYEKGVMEIVPQEAVR